MNDYVKVLLCMYPKFEIEAKRLEQKMEYKALTSQNHWLDPFVIAEDIIKIRSIKEEYLSVRVCLEKALATLPDKLLDAINFRFYHGEQPKDVSVRTVYRRTVAGIDKVARFLETQGYDKRWFMTYCAKDEEMRFLYRFYRSQTPIRLREQGSVEST